MRLFCTGGGRRIKDNLGKAISHARGHGPVLAGRQVLNHDLQAGRGVLDLDREFVA
jgi:hypothetical protein